MYTELVNHNYSFRSIYISYILECLTFFYKFGIMESSQLFLKDANLIIVFHIKIESLLVVGVHDNLPNLLSIGKTTSS